MADDDLSAIRNRRMAELQSQFAGPGSAADQDPAKVEEAKVKEDEMRNNFLSRVLSQEARARLNTIATAKPEKAKHVENMLLNMVRMGHIQGKLGEEELKSLLAKVSEHKSQRTPTVKFERKRNVMDDDDF